MNRFYLTNIEKASIKNKAFRRVLFTSGHQQLVLMSLLPGEEIGEEIHDNVDQFIRVEKGIGIAVIWDVPYLLKDGSAIVIPAGTKHNVINIDDEPMKLYTIYSPPNHPPGTLQYVK